MKKILIVSDSHKMYNLEELLEYETFDYAIHAGDSQLDYDSQTMQNFVHRVRGNCDFDVDFPTFDIFQDKEIGEVCVSHGHLFEIDVKYSKQAMLDFIENENINLMIYGHTHVVDIRYLKGDHLVINPGSVSQSKSAEYPETYVILSAMKNKYIVEIKDARSFKTLKSIKIERN